MPYDRKQPEGDELDRVIDFDVQAFNVTTVHIDETYAESMRGGYTVDPSFARIWQNVDNDFHFKKKDGLLFFIDVGGLERLYIPVTKEVGIF